MKKFISSVLVLVCVLSVVIITPSSITASAAGKTSKKYDSGHIVECGKYLFCTTNSLTGTAIYRLSKSGKILETLTTDSSSNYLYVYKDKLFFSDHIKVYCYNAKNNKRKALRSTSDTVCGVCSKGVITKNYSDKLGLISFKGRYKSLCNSSCSYIGSTDKYLFIKEQVSHSGDTETSRVKRYSLKNGRMKNTATFKSKCNSYGDYQSLVTDSCLLGNKIVFLCGFYEGSGSFFTGDVYSINSKGTTVKRLMSNVENELNNGKNAVYCTQWKSKAKLFRISKKGKVTKVATGDSYITATTANTSFMRRNNNGNSNLCFNKRISGSYGKTLIKGKSVLKSYDSSETYGIIDIFCGTGKYTLVQVTANDASQGGWRGTNLRSHYYIINVKTGKKSFLIEEIC